MKNNLQNFCINGQVLWLNLFQQTKFNKIRYVSFAADNEVFSVKIEIFFEAFFSCGVEDSSFDWSIIGGPVDKDHFADGHFIFVDEFKIINAITILVIGEWVDELLPSLVFLTDSFNDLDKWRLLRFFPWGFDRRCIWPQFF